jgi:hypothetical protein
VVAGTWTVVEERMLRVGRRVLRVGRRLVVIVEGRGTRFSRVRAYLMALKHSLIFSRWRSRSYCMLVVSRLVMIVRGGGGRVHSGATTFLIAFKSATIPRRYI